VVSVAIGLGLSACSDPEVESGASGSDETATTTEVRAPNVVTEQQIEAEAAGSPERALLSWWQAFQFADSDALLELTAEKTLDRVGKDELLDLAATNGAGFPGLEVVSATTSDDKAAVRGLVLTFDVDKNGVTQNTSTGRPETFEMRSEGGAWKFGASEFLESVLEQAQAAAG
jgi:hypothetical protein